MYTPEEALEVKKRLKELKKQGRKTSWKWRCQECGYTFRSAVDAEKAAFGDRGCPNCGGVDVDMSLPIRK